MKNRGCDIPYIPLVATPLLTQPNDHGQGLAAAFKGAVDP